MRQVGLFSYPVIDVRGARAARIEAVERVERGADEDWFEDALRTIEGLPPGRFITDALWQTLRIPKEPRALGPVMKAAEKMGLIEGTREFRPSAVVRGHQRNCRVWIRL